jgi:hypothetical protein
MLFLKPVKLGQDSAKWKIGSKEARKCGRAEN